MHLTGYWQADPHPGNLLVLNRRVDIGLIDFGQMKHLGDGQRVAFASLVDAMSRRSPDDVATGMADLGIVVEDIKADASTTKKPTAKRKRRGNRESTDVSWSQSSASSEPWRYQRKHNRPLGSKLASLAVPTPVHAEELAVATPPRTDGEADAGRKTRRSCKRKSLTSAEKLAYTMFDTAEVDGVSSNPFSDESALRTATVTDLPKELFFLLRTMQIMRGICAATGNSDYSLAKTWAPLARAAVKSGSKDSR